MHHPTDRIAHTTAFVTPVMEHCLEREIAQWVHHMKDRSDDPSHHERTLLPRSNISLLGHWNSSQKHTGNLGKHAFTTNITIVVSEALYIACVCVCVCVCVCAHILCLYFNIYLYLCRTTSWQRLQLLFIVADKQIFIAFTLALCSWFSKPPLFAS